MASLKVLDIPEAEIDNNKLKGHLSSKDFLEIDKFPMAKFTITNIIIYEEVGNSVAEQKDRAYTLANPTHIITGNFELKGIVKSITFPAKITIGKDKVEAEAKFNINRRDWGITYGTAQSFGDKLIRPIVHLGFQVIGNK